MYYARVMQNTCEMNVCLLVRILGNVKIVNNSPLLSAAIREKIEERLMMVEKTINENESV